MIWKLPRCPLLPPCRTSVTVYGSGEARADFHCLSQNVSCLEVWTKYVNPLPCFPFRHGLWRNVTSPKKVYCFILLFCLDSMNRSYQIRLAWVDFNVFIIVSVGHCTAATPSSPHNNHNHKLHHHHHDKT